MASAASMKLGSKSEVFQRQGQTWNCTTGLPSDITIDIGDSVFHLHKFPLLSRSGALERKIGESSGEEGVNCTIKLDDLPGGAKAFELVAKFCYGVKLELSAVNVVSLRCAAEKLQMTEEYGDRNLIFHTENFLTELLGSWKDSLKVLEACEEVLPHAEEVHITTRCINSLAVKACAESALYGWPMPVSDSTRSPGDTDLWNGISTDPKPKSAGVDWWCDDVSSLSLPLYKRFILAVESKGMKPESIAGSLTYYAKRYLSGLSRNSSLLDGTNRVTTSASDSALSDNDQKVLLEEIVGLLPGKHGVTSTKFLLRLLRTAMILHANSTCREGLENRIGAQLDDAALEDILIPNLGYSAETLYEIDCIQRILDHFILVDQSAGASSPSIIDEGQLIGTEISSNPIALVAKLMDGYLAEVAPDPNLKFPKFQAMAASIPDYARTIDDGLYRAIDIYLKAHPWLTDSEREQLCRLMNCQKLSLEACTHAAQNERLPLRMVVQVLFFEQLRLRTSIASWFFVSENLDNPLHHRGSIQLPKSNGPIQADGTHEPKEVGSEEMRSRVTELEKECSRMRLQIEKLGKPRSAWSNLSKKLGTKLKPQPFCNGEETPVNCQKESKDIVKSKSNFLNI